MLYIAPVQGHTDAAWRHFHHEVYGGNLHYFTPFMRAEHGGMRKQDLRDYTSSLNDGLMLEPQVIFRNMEELEILLSGLREVGATEVNLNMGCPFPLQTGKGRGAGFLRSTEEIARLGKTLAHYPELSYSVKMRLGHENPDEWRNLMPVLNAMELRHVDVHPRVAKQQYGGELHFNIFEEILAASRNPVVFNGELRTPADMRCIADKYDGISGMMMARGVLGRPSLAVEYEQGEEWSKAERLDKMLQFHRLLLDYYTSILCGESQVLSKIKPFWEYAEDEIGRKAWKAIRKAVNIAKYHSAVAMIGTE